MSSQIAYVLSPRATTIITLPTTGTPATFKSTVLSINYYEVTGFSPSCIFQVIPTDLPYPIATFGSLISIDATVMGNSDRFTEHSLLRLVLVSLG
ncbi:hypothetical protein DAMA08_047750 [Martiniozyma asiatica (nom. inval.)]|nr:hypothetical protein DAMA08_047750 [Martiniozyma asiatica]